ncbi:MAG: DedA family protein [Planctomycetota bacterium]|nr:DedA family protein [Planctomycetota bacterium]
MPFELSPLFAFWDWLLSDASYIWVIIFLVLTGCGLPIPEEVAIIACGVWASSGNMNPWLAMGACLIGCLIGDSIMYFIGYRFGRGILLDHPRFTGFLTPEREKKIEQLIQQRGTMVLFTSRFLVGIRSPVYLTAGIVRYPFRRFILTDLFCASVVIVFFFGLSYWFGPDITNWIRSAEKGLTIVLVIAALIGGFALWLHHRRGQKMLNKLDEVTAEISGSPACDLAKDEKSHDQSNPIV